MTLQSLKEQLMNLNRQIKPILEKSGYLKMADLLETEWDEYNPNDCMLVDEFLEVLSHLDYVYHTLSRLEKPVTHEGIIKYNHHEKYELDGIELANGQCVEVLVTDTYTKEHVWRESYVKYPADKSCSLIKSLVEDGVRGRIRD